MKKQYQRYEKEQLQAVVESSSSYMEVCRKLGKKPVGGNIINIKLMCKRWEISCVHMTGAAHNKGKRAKNRRTPAERLVMGKDTDHRITAYKLRNSMMEVGIEYKCNSCGIKEWNSKRLVLEVDHIDGQYWNNTQENLQFLCPNCHSQK